jgi:hypothetical protein
VANETTASTPVVNADFQGALIEDAMEDVVEETSSEVSAEEEAIDDAVGEEVGEIEATNDAVATQIETITQNVETLEASAMAKESVSSDERASSLRPASTKTKTREWTSSRASCGVGAAIGTPPPRAKARCVWNDAPRAIPRATWTSRRRPTPKSPRNGSRAPSGFDDAEDDAELAARAF